ncbi:hypothetical protein BGX27_011426 [Mortierella sp. AM989]|nr:hypothetical protein BGX27_011426 [Mortierella sp. AM989]
MNPFHLEGQRTTSSVKRRLTKEKLLKGDREEVWPPDVEDAFMKALEVLPKLGRRKVLVNGKPCGRNELIADYIYQQTQKVRDRKQVSSHIQVLKNTRKHDIAFMKLLMDSGDGDDDGASEVANTGYASTPHSPIPSFYMEHDRDRHGTFDERLSQLSDTNTSSLVPMSVIDGPSSRHDSNPSYSSLRRELSQHQNRYRVRSFTVSDIPSNHINAYDRPTTRATSIQPIYQRAVTTPDSAGSLSLGVGEKESLPCEKYTRERQGGNISACDLSSIHRELFRIVQPSRSIYSSFPFWPTAFGLYLHCTVMNMDSEGWSEESDFCESETHIHELARAQDFSPQELCNIDIHQLPPEKFPGLCDLYETASCPFLFLKIGVNLNLGLEGTFENTCIFGSNEHRTVQCLTLIYSFGAKVLESSETKQSTFVNGKLIHSFEYVNQFFNAFLSGIRTLGTVEEVEVALSNLSLVQIYEDLEPQMEGGSSLLVMVFDFERNHGTVTPYMISSRNA